jgi:hypothetical protein
MSAEGVSGMALSARDRRTAIIGVSVILATLVASRGVPSWRGWVREARAAAAEQVGAAARAASLVRGAGSLRDSLASRNARYLALAPTLLAGTSPAAAGATLASVVSGAAAESDVKLGAVQVHTVGRPAPTARGGAHAGAERAPAFWRIRAQGEMIGDIRGLTRFLVALEGGALRLKVRELTVTQTDPVGAADRPEVLRATVVVEGLAVVVGGGDPR